VTFGKIKTMATTTLTAPASTFADAARPALLSRVGHGVALTFAAISEGADAAYTYRAAVARGLGEQEAARITFERHFSDR
jgi:hypothetical protein